MEFKRERKVQNLPYCGREMTAKARRMRNSKLDMNICENDHKIVVDCTLMLVSSKIILESMQTHPKNLEVVSVLLCGNLNSRTRSPWMHPVRKRHCTIPGSGLGKDFEGKEEIKGATLSLEERQ